MHHTRRWGFSGSQSGCCSKDPEQEALENMDSCTWYTTHPMCSHRLITRPLGRRARHVWVTWPLLLVPPSLKVLEDKIIRDDKTEVLQ